MAATYLEVFVEDLSTEAALQILIPKIVPGLHFDVRVFQGKPDLLSKLPARLTASARGLLPEWRLLVLVDRDAQDCRRLKATLEQMARDAGLTTRAFSRSGRPIQVLN